MTTLATAQPQTHGLTFLSGETALISARRPVLPVGGKIRPGIKVLTAKAAANPKVAAIYEQGLASGKDFDTIEAEIKAAAPAVEQPLKPTNTPYFTVWPRDFAMPEIARLLLERFGEDRGDGAGRQLYRFPVLFPADNIEMILPHGLRCWGGGQLKYWSEYDGGGGLRCMQYVPIAVTNGKRAHKPFGGRKTMPRADTHGACAPECCREYQSDQCKLNGSLRFFVPGVPSIQAFELPTTSWYSLANIRETLASVALNRGGRVSGFLYRDKTFWVTKRLQPVSRITEEGKAVRELKWLIVLQADVDMGALLLERDNAHLRLASGEAAVERLNGDVVIDAAATVKADAVAEPVADKGAATAEHAPAAPTAQEDDAAAVQRLRIAVRDALTPLEVPTEAFGMYMQQLSGVKNWSRQRALLEQALALLSAPAPDVRALVGRIAHELRAQVRDRLAAQQIPEDGFDRYMRRRLRREDWPEQASALWSAVQLLKDYEGRSSLLVDLIDNELDA